MPSGLRQSPANGLSRSRHKPLERSELILMSQPEIIARVSPAGNSLDSENVAGPRLSDVAAKDLKRRTAHGALVSTGAQAASILLRTGSMMVLARLVLKE